MKYKIIVDKQSRTNPSTEKKEYIIDIEELRVKGDIYDSLIITKEEDYVMRRLKLSEYHVLSVLEEPIKQSIPDLNIELFEGDNYIYLLDMVGNKFYAEYLVKNDFTDTYVTRNEMNSSINQIAQQIDLSVNQKLTGYSTTEEMNALIQLLSNQINLELEKKVNGETITGAYLLLRINEDTSTAKIKADKLELIGYITATDLKTAGKTVINGSNITTGTIDASKATITNINANNITTGTLSASKIKGGSLNLTGANTTISSTNFNVDKNGKTEIIDVSKAMDFENTNLTILTSDRKIKNGIRPNGSVVSNQRSVYLASYIMNTWGMIDIGTPENYEAQIAATDMDSFVNLTAPNGQNTLINPTGITTPKLTQTSLKSKKKYIKKLKVNATDLIKNSDICLYNLKGEKAKSKKHIGLVIGEGYNCPSEVISEDGQGVEQYSMTSLAWKAIQELIEENQNLKQRIEKLEAK